MLSVLLLLDRTALISALGELLVQLPAVLRLLQLLLAVQLHRPSAGTMPSSVPKL